MTLKNIDWNDITDLEFDGIDYRDYPDFCDAYCCNATWESTGEYLNDEELDLLNDQHSETINELACQHAIERC